MMHITENSISDIENNTIIAPSLADTLADIFLNPVFQFENFLDHLQEGNCYTDEEFRKILYSDKFDVLKIAGAVADPKRYDADFFARFKCERGSILHYMFNSFIAGIDAERRMEAMARETEEEGNGNHVSGKQEVSF